MEGWAALGSLKTLALPKNNLPGTLAAAFPASLQQLDLSENMLTAVRPFWRPPPGLRRLNLSLNSLNQSLSEQQGWLAAASQLEVLDLGANQLQGTVPADLVLPPWLVQLDLRLNQLNGQCARRQVYVTGKQLHAGCPCKTLIRTH